MVTPDNLGNQRELSLMLHRLIVKVTKFQLPPPKRLRTVIRNILGAIMPPPMSNRDKAGTCRNCPIYYVIFLIHVRASTGMRILT